MDRVLENIRNQIIAVVSTGILTMVGAVVWTNYRFMDSINSRINTIEKSTEDIRKSIDKIDERQYKIMEEKKA